MGYCVTKAIYDRVRQQYVEINKHILLLLVMLLLLS